MLNFEVNHILRSYRKQENLQPSPCFHKFDNSEIEDYSIYCYSASTDFIKQVFK